MKIAHQDCPEGFFVRNEDFTKMLYMARIVRWDQVGFALGEQ